MRIESNWAASLKQDTSHALLRCINHHLKLISAIDSSLHVREFKEDILRDEMLQDFKRFFLVGAPANAQVARDP